MRILLVDPGAEHSTGDVYRGYLAAFARAGHEAIPYSVTARYEQASVALDRAWRATKGSRPRPTEADISYRATEGVLAHALRFQPDWVFIVSAMYLHPDFLIYLRRGGFRVGLILTESPYADSHQSRLVPFVDVAWTQERRSVEFLRHAQPHVFYLPAAYDAERHRPDLPIPEGTPAHDVVLVAHGFVERCKLLSEVDWTGIDLGLYGDWRPLNGRAKLRQQATVRQGIIDNAETVALYRAAKIGLGLFRASEDYSDADRAIRPAESVNPRTMELAASGCFQISEYRPEVAEIFRLAVPTFSTPVELGRLVRAYLKNPSLRNLDAACAIGWVKGHSFDDRVRQIERDISTVGGRAGRLSRGRTPSQDTMERAELSTSPRPAERLSASRT